MTGKNTTRHALSVALLGATLAALVASGCRSALETPGDIASARAAAFEVWRRGEEVTPGSDGMSAGRLSLHDAVRSALAHNTGLKIAEEGRAVARARIRAARSGFLPGLSIQAGYRRDGEVPFLDVGGGPYEMGAEQNLSVDLTLTQPVWHGGASAARMRAARLFSQTIDERTRQAAQDTVFAVASEYYGALLARRLFEAHKAGVDSAERYLAEMREYREAGRASDFDVRRTEVDLAAFRADMIAQRNSLRLGVARLLRLMGVSQRSEVTLSDELAYVAVSPDVEEAVETAYTNRPEVLQAELNLREQKEWLRVARSGYLPRVDAYATQHWSRPDPVDLSRTDEWGDQWRVGATVRWTLFDGMRREGKIMEKRARLEQARLALRDAEERVLLEVRQTILRLQDADELVESQRQNVSRAEEALRLAEAGRQAGTRSTLEVVDARAALTRAQALHHKGLFEHTMARLMLQRAMGVLGSESLGGEGLPAAREGGGRRALQ